MHDKAGAATGEQLAELPRRELDVWAPGTDHSVALLAEARRNVAAEKAPVSCHDRRHAAALRTAPPNRPKNPSGERSSCQVLRHRR